MLKRLCLVLVAGGALAACSESTVPTAPPAQTPNLVAPNQLVIAELSCRVDATSMRCAPKGATSDAAFSPELIFGGQNKFVKLTSTNVTTTSGVSTTADVTMQNLTAQVWNTKDGVNPDTGGVKVFFATGPDHGVTLHNGADGSDTFTASGQPFYKYLAELGAVDQVLTPNETSAPKTWQFDLNGYTGTWNFSVLLVTKMQDETGPLLWSTDALAGTSAYRLAVFAASPTDVWNGGAPGANAFQHFNGTSWSSTLWPYGINGLWGSSGGNVYAATDSGVAHYNGSSWAQETYTPPGGAAPKALYAIWGTSTSDIYAGGANATLAHYNGTAWSNVTGSGIPAGEDVTALWGSSTSDFYAGTFNGASGVYHFNGTAWSPVAAGVADVNSIWGSSSTDVYVGGRDGILRHWNGTTWTGISGLGGVVGFGDNDILGIWGLSANSVYLVQRDGDIWHWNGVNWLQRTNAGTTLVAISGSGSSVFAVGYNSTTSNGVAVRGHR